MERLYACHLGCFMIDVVLCASIVGVHLMWCYWYTAEASHVLILHPAVYCDAGIALGSLHEMSLSIHYLFCISAVRLYDVYARDGFICAYTSEAVAAKWGA